MNKLIFFSLLNLFLIFTMNCSSQERDIQQLILGKWDLELKADFKWTKEFTEDGYYNVYVNDYQETNFYINDILYHKFRYEIIQKGKFNRLLIYGVSPDNLTLVENYLIEIHDGKLSMVSYKTLKGITHHIDEMGIWNSRKKENTNTTNEKELKSKFIFQKNFRGLSLIAFDEPKGKETSIDARNCKEYFIPENGLLKVKGKANPFEILKEQVQFLLENENGTFQEIPIINSQNSLEKYDVDGIDKEKVFIIINGFNQIDRPRVNSKLFKSKVNNDVLFLSVGTAENIYNVWKETINLIQE